MESLKEQPADDNLLSALRQVNAFLGRQEAVLRDGLRAIQQRYEAEKHLLTQNLLKLDKDVDAAKQRGRARRVEELEQKRETVLKSLTSLGDEKTSAEVQMHGYHRRSTAAEQQLKKRLEHVLEEQAAMARQRELQIKRITPIPTI